MYLTASLVLYHNNPDQFGAAIQSFLNGCDGLLTVVDNSSSPIPHRLFSHSRVRYVHSGKNLGFGRGHNLAISLIQEASDVHLFLNPDVIFAPDVLPGLLGYLQENSSVGALMPRVNYPDGTLQYLCKLLPTPFDLFLRRFIPLDRLTGFVNRRYELHGLRQDKPSTVPVLSGCFLLVRYDLLKALKGFDERYFMYMEDVDLVRRVGDKAQTVYLPAFQVTHQYARGSYRSVRLLGYHVRSAVQYFYKWGWFFDRTRKSRNRDALLAVLNERE
jgi:GT2 family glycosyltransferase